MTFFIGIVSNNLKRNVSDLVEYRKDRKLMGLVGVKSDKTCERTIRKSEHRVKTFDRVNWL